MSTVTIYSIDAVTGEISVFDEVRNAMGGALLIWATLGSIYSNEPMSWSKPGCWELANRGAMSDRDCLVCGFTFDGCYVARENCVALADALDSFFEEHLNTAHPTIPKIAASLRMFAEDDTVRGACFQQTSAAADSWIAESNDGEYAPFIFTDGAKRADGREPFELFAEFAGAGLAERRAP